MFCHITLKVQNVSANFLVLVWDSGKRFIFNVCSFVLCRLHHKQHRILSLIIMVQLNCDWHGNNVFPIYTGDLTSRIFSIHFISILLLTFTKSESKSV
jgi:hypothetical protein